MILLDNMASLFQIMPQNNFEIIKYDYEQLTRPFCLDRQQWVFKVHSSPGQD